MSYSAHVFGVHLANFAFAASIGAYFLGSHPKKLVDSEEVC